MAAMSTGQNTEKFRIDKWLCAARFFKTRSLAAEAVECGHVHVNEVRVKPAKAIAVGDMLDIHFGQKQYTVVVLGLSDIRGPASVAQLLYRETDISLQRREEIAARRKDQPQPFRFRGRPTKRDRREIERLTRGKR
jgi:ribosome-associated heat shock protein Hsp15